jgi:hypothetical protein
MTTIWLCVSQFLFPRSAQPDYAGPWDQRGQRDLFVPLHGPSASLLCSLAPLLLLSVAVIATLSPPIQNATGLVRVSSELPCSPDGITPCTTRLSSRILDHLTPYPEKPLQPGAKDPQSELFGGSSAPRLASHWGRHHRACAQSFPPSFGAL